MLGDGRHLQGRKGKDRPRALRTLRSTMRQQSGSRVKLGNGRGQTSSCREKEIHSNKLSLVCRPWTLDAGHW